MKLCPFTRLFSSSSDVSFIRPLLDDGYKPAVISHEEGEEIPILLYLPGFDGTLLAPFLQFPELNTILDVVGMNIKMNDRSSFESLQKKVIEKMIELSSLNDNRPIYLMGESFGGILASSVALQVQDKYSEKINLKGLTLINPATSYLSSKLAELGPPVSKLPALLYPLGILIQLVPLFVDQYQLPQLMMILQSKALPSVIDSADREAYMGRVALSLSQRLEFMPQETLKWRLEEWLTVGCRQLQVRQQQSEHEYEEPLSKLSKSLRTLVIVGEDDKTLPSLDEARRLVNIIPNSSMFVVEGAGHANTCGSRVDLAALLRGQFDELQTNNKDRAQQNRIEMKEEARKGKGIYFGMEQRYDGNTKIGMLPTRYWDKDVYKEYKI